MTDLYLASRRVESIFDLMGFHENDLTKAVGWSLSRSSAFQEAFLRSILGEAVSPAEAIRLQRFGRKDKGFTDVEVERDPDFLIVVEAKRYWDIPGAAQLRKYAERMSAFKLSAMVSVSQWPRDHAEPMLARIVSDQGIQLTNGRFINVTHRSWTDVHQLARQARRRAPNREKIWLDFLMRYMEFVMNDQNQRSNMVFVVPLGATAKVGGHSTRDLAVAHRLYTYPVGKGRLKKPPNYIAFSFDGLLQSIHHVEAYDYTDEGRAAPLLATLGIQFDRPHFVFKLGEPFAPAHKVIARVRNRQWCLLDTLLTCKSLSEAQAVKSARLTGQMDEEDEA